MRIVARIRPVFALLLCFGSVLLAVPVSAASPQRSVEQVAPSAPEPESQGAKAPCISDEGAESETEPEMDARRRLCALQLGPGSVALGKTFALESVRLRQEDRRRCRPPNR